MKSSASWPSCNPKSQNYRTALAPPRGNEPHADRIAEMLFGAMLSGEYVDPPSASFALDGALASAARRNLSHRLARRYGPPRGYKIGFTSAVIQNALGIDSPEFGYLFDEYVVPPGQSVEAGRKRAVYAEPEIAFVIGAPLEGDGVSDQDVLQAVDCICPAIELVDSRVGLLTASALDMVADNVAASKVVLGQERFDPAEYELSDIPVTISVGGEAHSGNTGNVMGSPVRAVSWLAARLSESSGEDGAINPGDIIMTGSCTNYVEIKAGTRLRAEFGPLGLLEFNIV